MYACIHLLGFNFLLVVLILANLFDFQFFTSTFRGFLDNKESHKSELTIAIKGIGLLVDVCSDVELKDLLFAKILKHVENIIAE